MATTCPLRAIVTGFLTSLLIVATTPCARAQEVGDVPVANEHFPRFRLAGSIEHGNADAAGFGAAGSSVSLSYDFFRLSHVPGDTHDPAALSLYVDSTGDNPLHQSYGSSLFGGVTVRSPARPLYVLFGLGFSHDNLYDDETTYVTNATGEYVTSYRVYNPAARLGLRLFLGLDIPKTPIFLEAGGGVDVGGITPGASLQFGIRL